MTTFEQRDNSFRLFKNDRKDSDKHPDYRGDGMIDGTLVWVSAWLKVDKNGGKFMSCSVQPKEKRGGDYEPKRDSHQRPLSEDIDDSIPFGWVIAALVLPFAAMAASHLA